MNWYAVDVEATAEAREAVAYALMEAGALGTEERQNGARGELVCVAGYFEAVPEIESVRAALLDALRIYGHATPDVRAMNLREVAGQDWLAEWKKSWQPVEVGRFIVAPSWVETHVDPGRILIRIEPGMAFGTGTHETTRLCLAATGRHFKGGSFLDVGTGTGILAIAAAQLRPEASVEACDTDPLALTIAHDNAMLNGVAERINFRVGTVTDDTASADCVTANLTAGVIIEMLPALLGATCGHLILSGILTSQVASVTTRLRELGTANYEVTTDGEWACIIV